MSAATIPVEEFQFIIDIYSGQGLPNMPALEKEKYAAVWSKATGEGAYVNPFWERNRQEVRKTKMLFGTYDWIEPQSGMSGAAAALDYWRTINFYSPVASGEFILLDFETPDWFKGPLGRSIEPFMRENIFTLLDLSAQRIGLYSATYFLQETGAVNWSWLNDPRIFYWQAAPGATGTMPDNSFWPATSPPFSRTVVHQHDWHGISSAVQMEFDRNRFWGTFEELKAFGKSGNVPPVEVEGDMQEPPPGKVSWYINANKNPIVVWNPGGQTEKIVDVNFANLGIGVQSFTEPAVILEASIFDGVPTGYHVRDSGAHKQFLSALTAGEPLKAGEVSGDTYVRPKPEQYVPDSRDLEKGVPKYSLRSESKKE